MTFNASHLMMLGLKESDLTNLTEDEQITLITRTCQKLDLKYRLEYSTLETEDEKRLFAQRYAPFLNLKASLERMNESLTQSIIREWRELILQTYGEEYLNDFEYGNALATGDLYPILATRKLLSPIKALSALINGLLIIPFCAFNYVYKLVAELMSDLNTLVSEHHLGRYDHRKIVLFFRNIMYMTTILCSSIALLLQLPLPLMTVIFCIPLIPRLLSALASPVNQLFRPLAAYFDTDPSRITLLALVTLPALLSGLIYAIAATGILATLPYISLALNILFLIGTAKLIYDLYALNSQVGTFTGIFTLGAVICSYFLPTPPSDMLSEFFIRVSSCVMIYFGIRFLQNIKSTLDDLSTSLPLPNEPIPQPNEEALLGYTNASTQSHRFFNTPEGAECLPKIGRSTWQQTCSFFGREPNSEIEEMVVTDHEQSLRQKG